MRFLIATAFLMIGSAGAAQASPCEGKLPAPGATFTGEVRYVIDGDGFCVSDNADQKTWVGVRASDFNARELNKPGGPQARDALKEVALGQPATCVAGRKSRGSTVASCMIGGKSIGDLMAEKGIAQGGSR